MTAKPAKFKIWLCLTLVVFIAWFLEINYLSPIYPDEMVNSLLIENSYDKNYNSIGFVSNFYDVLSNFKKIYFSWTGRFSSSILVYSFSALPKWVFGAFNSIVFFFFILFVYMRCAKEENEFRSLITLFFLAFLILSNPLFSETMVWQTGSLVYFFVVVSSLYFVFPYSKLLNGSDKFEGQSFFFSALKMFIAGVVVGGGLEHLSASLVLTVFAILVWLTASSKQKPIWSYFGFLGLVIGSLLLLLSPGNNVRAGGQLSASFHSLISIDRSIKFFNEVIGFLFSNATFFVVFSLFGLVFFAFYRGKGFCRSTVAESRLFLAVGVLSFLAMYASPVRPTRAYSVGIFYLILFCLYNFEMLLNIIYIQFFTRPSYWRSALSGFLFAFIASATIWYAASITAQYVYVNAAMNERVDFLRKSVSDGFTILTVPAIDRAKIPNVYMLDLQDNPENWVNRTYGRLYGVNFLGLNSKFSKYKISACGSNILLSAHDFDQNITLKSIRLQAVNNHVLAVFDFESSLDLERLYKFGKKLNQIAVNFYGLDGVVNWNTVYPFYKLTSQGYRYVAALDLGAPRDGELFIAVYNPDSGTIFPSSLRVKLDATALGCAIDPAL